MQNTLTKDRMGNYLRVQCNNPSKSYIIVLLMFNVTMWQILFRVYYLEKFGSRKELFLSKKLLSFLLFNNYVTNSIFVFAIAATKFSLKLMLITILNEPRWLKYLLPLSFYVTLWHWFSVINKHFYVYITS